MIQAESYYSHLNITRMSKQNVPTREGVTHTLALAYTGAMSPLGKGGAPVSTVDEQVAELEEETLRGSMLCGDCLHSENLIMIHSISLMWRDGIRPQRDVPLEVPPPSRSPMDPNNGRSASYLYMFATYAPRDIRRHRCGRVSFGEPRIGGRRTRGCC
jgi:hypothetical protein